MVKGGGSSNPEYHSNLLNGPDENFFFFNIHFIDNKDNPIKYTPFKIKFNRSEGWPGQRKMFIFDQLKETERFSDLNISNEDDYIIMAKDDEYGYFEMDDRWLNDESNNVESNNNESNNDLYIKIMTYI